jgi:hypothetical protein
MSKIRETEIRRQEESKRETYSAFDEMRRIGQEVLQSTREVKHAYDVKDSSRMRAIQMARAMNIDAQRQLGFTKRQANTHTRTEQSMMEFEERRSNALMSALKKLAQSGGNVSDASAHGGRDSLPYISRPSDAQSLEHRKERMIVAAETAKKAHKLAAYQNLAKDINGVYEDKAHSSISIMMTPLPPDQSDRRGLTNPDVQITHESSGKQRSVNKNQMFSLDDKMSGDDLRVSAHFRAASSTTVSRFSPSSSVASRSSRGSSNNLSTDRSPAHRPQDLSYMDVQGHVPTREDGSVGNRRGSYDQFSQEGPEELEWNVWSQLQNRKAVLPEAKGDDDPAREWDLEFAAMGRKSQIKSFEKAKRVPKSPTNHVKDNGRARREQKNLWPLPTESKGQNLPTTQSGSDDDDDDDNDEIDVSGGDTKSELELAADRSTRIATLHTKMVQRAHVAENEKAERANALFHVAEQERVVASQRRQKYEQLRRKAERLLGKKSAVSPGAKVTASELRSIANGSDLASMIAMESSLRGYSGESADDDGLQKLQVAQRLSHRAGSDGLARSDVELLQEAASALTTKGLLSMEELAALGSVTPGLSGSTPGQDAAVLDAATFIMDRKSRGASIIAAAPSSRRHSGDGKQSGDAQALKSASEIMRRKKRGMSIVGEAALSMPPDSITSNIDSDGKDEVLFDVQFGSKGETQSLLSPLASAILERGGAHSSAEISRLEPQTGDSLIVGTVQSSRRGKHILGQAGGTFSREFSGDWLLNPKRSRLGKPPAGIRTASILLRGDDAANLKRNFLPRNRPGLLPAPPRGVRSASIIELDRARNGISSAVKFYGGENSSATSSTNYPREFGAKSYLSNNAHGSTPLHGRTRHALSHDVAKRAKRDNITPLSPAAVSSTLYRASKLPPPPPGVRPASVLIAAKQANKTRRGKARNLKAQESADEAADGEHEVDPRDPTADNTELELWIRENIPFDVLSGDVPTGTMDPSAPLLRAHLSAKTSFQKRHPLEQNGMTSGTPEPSYEKRPQKSPFKDYNYLGMEHPEVWVPSGSGPSSFHRQQLIEAKSALKTLKASAKQRAVSGGSSYRQSPLRPATTRRDGWPQPTLSTQRDAHDMSSSPTVTAAKMVPIPDSMLSSSSLDNGDGDDDDSNDEDGRDSDSFDDLADPELVRIRKGVKLLEKTGSYPSTDVSHTHSRYVQSWENSPNRVGNEDGFHGVRPLSVPDDLDEAPRFLQRAMRVAQEANFAFARQAAKKSRAGGQI